MRRRFTQVDVFGRRALHGNPLAVVHDADDLSTDAMQQLARWTNLSETVFLSGPTVDGADYAVRIFTLAGELPFAGHPTLGAAHAWLAGRDGEPATGGRAGVRCGSGHRPPRRPSPRLRRPTAATLRTRRRRRPGRPARRAGPRPVGGRRRRLGGQRPGVVRPAARGRGRRPGGRTRCLALAARRDAGHRPRRSASGRVAGRRRGACPVHRRHGRAARGPGDRQPQRVRRAVAAGQRPRHRPLRRRAGHQARAARQGARGPRRCRHRVGGRDHRHRRPGRDHL